MGLNTKFDELLDFPCQFPFKVLGVADDALADQVIAVLQQHAPGDYSPSIKPSSKGNYLGATAQVNVESQEQLDKIYHALTAHPMVKMVL